jgi:DNA repair exonuclease SbcCD ATPase subunit
MKTTRELDDSYYSCLEKLAVLQSTISTLQELSTLTRQLHEGFQGEAGDLKTEMESQIEAFGGFHDQNERIDGLEMRVKSSKTKADELSARLEDARARVETLEASEEEWQSTVSRKLK